MATEGVGADYRRVFVSRLAPYTKRKDLLRLFRDDGIEHVVVRQKSSGNTGYLTFRTAGQARAVVSRSESAGFFLHKKKLRLILADSWNQRCCGGSDGMGSGVSLVPSCSGREMRLPLECLAEVARYLPYKDRARMELVSQLWRKASLESHRGTTTLKLTTWEWQTSWGYDERITSRGLYWALQRVGPWLRSLVLDEQSVAELIEPQLISIAAKVCPVLQELDTTAITLRPGSLRAIAENISTLRLLRLGRVNGPVDPDLRQLFASNENLTVIDLRCVEMTGGSLQSLGCFVRDLGIEKCDILRSELLADFLGRQESLRSLYIAGCRRLARGPLLRAVIGNKYFNDTLRVLQLPALGHRSEAADDGPQEEDDFEPQEDVQFFVLLDRDPLEEGPGLPSACTSLETLEIPMCSWVDNHFIREMGCHLHRIERLDLTACTNVHGEWGLDPLRELVTLRALYISYMHPSVTTSFLPELINLEMLEARGNPGVHVEDVCGLLRRVRSLYHVDLEACRGIDRTVVRCAYEVVTTTDRQRPLHLFLGDTNAKRCRRDRQNLYLLVHYKTLSARLPFV